MLNKAIEKIKTEIDGNKNNPYIQVVGEFLLQHLQVNPNDAEKIVQEGKSISKSFDEMRKVAEKRQVNKCGMIDPTDVLKYFGIEGTITAAITKSVAVGKTPIAQDKKLDIEFNIELDF